jgi:integrase/recombinase XerD
MRLYSKLSSSSYRAKQTSPYIEDCLVQFENHLQRGLSEGYRKNLLSVARLFLFEFFKQKEIEFSRIKPSNITKFVNHYSQHDSPQNNQNTYSALRKFLRFLKFKGFVETDYSGIVVHAPIWRMDRIPEYLTDDEIVKIQNVCDKETPVGLRDYSILRLLGGLGLRACEIARLTLEDFDWTNGELIVHGKGSRISRMPLTQALGDVIVTYLLNGRPNCSSRCLFISAYPPFHGLISRSISQIVARIFKRAGLKKKGKAHLFRHTFATKLLNKGATL